MDIDDQIKRYFRGKEGYNCAQAVLKVCKQQFNVADEDIPKYSNMGGGRAPEGVCGAFHSAFMLAGKDKEEALSKAFLEKASFLNCKEIRKTKTLSCEQCVKLAIKEVCNYKL